MLDLQLCSTLAFWCARDAAQMDRLFRQSALFRPKWDARHFADGRTYGEATIAKAIASCAEVYTRGGRRHRADRTTRPAREEPSRVRLVSDAVVPPPAPPPSEPYTFTPAFEPTHFVSQMIAYASTCTDAAHEYHEAAALILLASVTPNVRARLRPYPSGLPTAFYALFMGDSTISRKSTSKNLAKDLLARVVPDALLAERSSPEAFVEQLALRSGDSATWWVDEFGETLDHLHHAKYMTGLRGLLLELYEGADHRSRRTTKRTKSGTPIPDEMIVTRPHLSLLGCGTPAIFEILSSRDLSSGFLARFSIVMPTGKPARLPLYAMGADDDDARDALTRRLHGLYAWAASASRQVVFTGDTLQALDAVAAALEAEAATTSRPAQTMFERLAAMVIKVAMLSAAGHPKATERDDLRVTPADVQTAQVVTTRWKEAALRFAGRVGENDFERVLERCLDHARRRGDRVLRRVIAQVAHVSKDTLDKFEATLEDRGQIRIVSTGSRSGPEPISWEVVD